MCVFAMPHEPTWMTGASVTDDGRYMLMYVRVGCLRKNRLYYVDLQVGGWR